MKELLFGIGTLGFGLYFLIRRKRLSRDMADKMIGYKPSPPDRFFYSEEYFLGLYGFGGAMGSLMGTLLILSAIEVKPDSIIGSIKYFLTVILVIVAFGGGLLFIIRSNWRNWRDK